jgi:hypothetical protein
MAGFGLVAVLVGHGASEPASPSASRSPAHPRYFTLCEGGYADRPGPVPRFRDTETGSDTPCPIPGAWGATQLSCSPWRDSEEQYHLVGVCPDDAGNPYGLVRYSFPARRVLGRISLDFLPVGRPCWSPDRGDRILFAGSDGGLYLYDFPEFGGGRSRDRARPQELEWKTRPPGVGRFYVQEACWPGERALDGRVLVSMSYRLDLSEPEWTVRLWWLKLSPDGGAIVAAERAILPGDDDRDGVRSEERQPSVGTARDGTPLLAYLAYDQGQDDWRLWVIPVAAAASGRAPQVLASAGRVQATRCALVMTPTFSSDGRWIYASCWVGRKFRVHRFAVDIATEGSTAKYRACEIPP